MLIFGFKEFVTNPIESLNKIYDFLGIGFLGKDRLNLKPSNKRSYNRKMTIKEIQYLQDIYDPYNEELFELLGYKPNW